MFWSLQARNVAGVKHCYSHQAETPPPPSSAQQKIAVGFTQLAEKNTCKQKALLKAELMKLWWDLK